MCNGSCSFQPVPRVLQDLPAMLANANYDNVSYASSLRTKLMLHHVWQALNTRSTGAATRPAPELFEPGGGGGC